MANVVTKKVTSILCEASLDAIAEGADENEDERSFPSTELLPRAKVARSKRVSPHRSRVPRDPSGELVASLSSELKPKVSGSDISSESPRSYPASQRQKEARSPTKSSKTNSSVGSPERRQNESVPSLSDFPKAKSMRCISPSKQSLQKNNSCRSLGANLSSPQKRNARAKKNGVHGSPKKKRHSGSHPRSEMDRSGHKSEPKPEVAPIPLEYPAKTFEGTNHLQTESNADSTKHGPVNVVSEIESDLSQQRRNTSSGEKGEPILVLHDDSSSSGGDKDIVFDASDFYASRTDTAVPSAPPQTSPEAGDQNKANTIMPPIPAASSSSSASSGSKNGKISASPSSDEDKLSKRSPSKTPKPKTKSKPATGRTRKNPTPEFDGEMSLTLGEIFDTEELFEEPKTPSPSARSKSPRRRKLKPSDNLPSVQEDEAPREGSSSSAVETVPADIELTVSTVPDEPATVTASNKADLPSSTDFVKKETLPNKTTSKEADQPLSSIDSVKKDPYNYDAEYSDPSMQSSSEREDEDSDPLTWRLDPVQSLSDWTIVATSKEDGSVEQFHVHKNMLAVGKRKSEFFVDAFKKMANDPSAPAVTKISMGSVAMKAIPTLLDYMYSSEPLNVTTENAIGLRYLSQVFGMKTVFKCAMTFVQADLCLAKIPHYYTTSKSLGDRKMLAIAAKHCGRNVLKINVDSPLLPLVSPNFLVEVSKSPGIDSGERARHISLLVAEYCLIHKDRLDGNAFLKLTNEENMPVIHEEAVLPLLDLESDLVVTTSLLSFTSMSSLQKRCLRDIAGSWHEISAIDPEEVSRVMRKLPSFVVAELLAKSLANIKQPSKKESTVTDGFVSKEVVELSLQKLRAAHEDELAQVESEQAQEIERLKATIAEKETALARYRKELERFTRLPNSHEGKLVGSGPLKRFPTSIPEVIPCEKEGYLLVSKKEGVKYPVFYYKFP